MPPSPLCAGLVELAADRAGIHRLADERGHARDLLGRGLALHGRVAHPRCAPRRADVAGEVHRAAAALQLREVFGEGLELPADALP